MELVGIIVPRGAAGRTVDMLARYLLAGGSTVLRDAPLDERLARFRRIETVSTLSGAMILLAMVATLLVANG
jgi:hypothetical protein